MQSNESRNLTLNSSGYLEAPGVTVTSYNDTYPEGHQHGVTVILNGSRIAANGDVRLDPVPGQWQPISRLESRVVDPQRQAIVSRLCYPDPSRNRTGFNPIDYPDLHFQYEVTVVPDGSSVTITVDLCEPLPKSWQDRVAFNLELFPGEYFGASWFMDGTSGTFPRQLIGPYHVDPRAGILGVPLAEGRVLSVAPESPEKHLTIEATGAKLQLLDGTAQHNNGWFVVRSMLEGSKTAHALVWKLTPRGSANWRYGPVVHVSQVGYHPAQDKVAIIELDPRDEVVETATVFRVDATGTAEVVVQGHPKVWGKFLRYHYVVFDFSEIRTPGIYRVVYAGKESNIFRVAADIYSKGVWQPTLEYFLPVQMCHMRVNDRYRVWHGLCHMDDARMAPTGIVHFDGYSQGSETLTPHRAMDPVPGLNTGGWHDAGDYDLRIDSQIGTVRLLALTWEAFRPEYDATTIDQATHVVELHRPDGRPDILQQIEHGVLSVLAGYRALGRLYRGIICPTLRQYVLLGDASNSTDNRVGSSEVGPSYLEPNRATTPDDRWVFTEENPGNELIAAAGLAAAARALSEYDASLAAECQQVAATLVRDAKSSDTSCVVCARIEALAELILLTRDPEFETELVSLLPEIVRHVDEIGWVLGRLIGVIDQPEFHRRIRDAIEPLGTAIRTRCSTNPFGVHYEPGTWGAGWPVQSFGFRQYHLHSGWPDLFDASPVLNALNFVLGVHPGANPASFVSGVGARSMTTTYGANRADYSYIPGGVVVGTGLIQPDFPELKDWPYLWQQGEYFVSNGCCEYLFLVLAVERLLNGGEAAPRSGGERPRRLSASESSAARDLWRS